MQSLASLNLNTYCYAPKEDLQHRFKWREAHSREWHESFSKLCNTAATTSVEVIAGIAPGLDFNYSTDSDFDRLLHKSQQYLDSGASKILLLWDDIDDEFTTDISLSEGTAHARTVNQLSAALDQPIWTVPRVYAAEIENKHNYLQDFFTELAPQHTVLLCGNAIVASKVQHKDLTQLSHSEQTNESVGTLKHQTVVWDNFYANDYCPRRLFIGSWNGREEVADYLINPTGMPFTDKLILDVVVSTHTAKNKNDAWVDALRRHGVPAAFLDIATCFSKPCFGDTVDQSLTETTALTHMHTESDTQAIEEAIEHCLWKWKSPLAREWYPFIMSLKHDYGLLRGSLPTDRILKTQTGFLARHLLKDS